MQDNYCSKSKVRGQSISAPRAIRGIECSYAIGGKPLRCTPSIDVPRESAPTEEHGLTHCPESIAYVPTRWIRRVQSRHCAWELVPDSSFLLDHHVIFHQLQGLPVGPEVESMASEEPRECRAVGDEREMSSHQIFQRSRQRMYYLKNA